MSDVSPVLACSTGKMCYLITVVRTFYRISIAHAADRLLPQLNIGEKWPPVVAK